MLGIAVMGVGYAAWNAYFLFRILRWMDSLGGIAEKKQVRIPVAVVYALIALSPYAGFFLPNGIKAKAALSGLSNFWLGECIYAAMTLGVIDLSWLVTVWIKKRRGQAVAPRSHRERLIAGVLCLAVTATVSLYGYVNAQIIRVKHYDIAVHKSAGSVKELTVVLAADLHMGYSIGTRQISRMAELINAQNPDLVVLAGDIFDNDYDALDDPAALAGQLGRIRSKYGVYACYGNHDVQEALLGGFRVSLGPRERVSDPRMDQFLQDAGVTLLMDEGVLIDDSFYLYGRPDLKNPGRGISTRKTPHQLTQGMDLSKPLIVLDHEPKELDDLARAGVDVDLSGHTHAGQFFPLTIGTALMWENNVGHLQKGDMHSIVTAGVGLYGPYSRVGTVPDISVVHIHFD